jgi:hypothetical protein
MSDINIENINIDDLNNEISNIEKNIKNDKSKINIIIILTDNNNNIENIIRKKQEIKENILKLEIVKEIINKVKEKYCKENYKINYLLNFSINTNVDTLDYLNENSKDKILSSEDSKVINEDIFKLDILNKLNDYEINEINEKDNISNFEDVNSLILILNKIEKKYYIKRKIIKKNTTRRIKRGV